MINGNLLKKEIAQITWINYFNFGTYLQAYALQQSLKKIGYQSSIINDIYFNPLLVPKNSNILKIKSVLKRILGRYKEEVRRKDLYKNFAERYLKIDCSCTSFNQLAEKYKVFICGSDQIWSPLLQSQSDGYYFASFAPKTSIKISYASSFGSKTYDSNYKDLVTPWVSEFDALSAREESGVRILKELSGRENIIEVCDPTLLIDTDGWRSLFSSNYPKQKPYMLCYFLSFNKDYLKKCKELALEKNLELISFNNIPNLRKSVDRLIEAGPLEFLQAISNSSYFATDSFHGTIFALQFQKSFITFKRFKESDINNQNSRIENLLSKVGLSEHFVENISLSTLPQDPDWKNVNERINSMRLKSLSFLKHSLIDGIGN